MSHIDLKSLPVDEVIKIAGVAKAIGIKSVASLLFTYGCTIACRHCLFNCSPKFANMYVNIDDGLEFLRQLRATDRVIHIAGGEPMMHYDQMLKICQIANSKGFAPHFIETNASWCINDDITVNRYEELRNAGVLGIYISADPYHQAFVLPENRLRAYKWAVNIFGRENVAAADLSFEQLTELRHIGQDDSLLADYTRRNSPKLVGRAGEILAKFFHDRPLNHLLKDSLWRSASNDGSCRPEFDSREMWEIHIDPYGNIQTCCGIILGNVYNKPLSEYIEMGFHNGNELIKMVYDQGPFAYLEIAMKYGYQPRNGYPQKCNLCWEVRKFLRPFFPETFGPAEIYEKIF